MFSDLKERAQLKAKEAQTQKERRTHVKWLLRQVVVDALPEIESLGFSKVTLNLYETIPSFDLRIQIRQGYSSYDFTYNLSLSSIKNVIYYGVGAHSSKGQEMKFDCEWNDSKLIATMKSTLRALVGSALERLEIEKLKNN